MKRLPISMGFSVFSVVMPLPTTGKISDTEDTEDGENTEKAKHPLSREVE
jgi:hypothetical protein